VSLTGGILEEMRNEYILLGVEFRLTNHSENLSADGSVRNSTKWDMKMRTGLMRLTTGIQ
jgi:hypothetical protein